MVQIHYDAIQDIYQPQLNPIEKTPGKFFCLNCKKTVDQKQYFKTNRLDKFPAGILPHCKACVTMKIDDQDPMTFLPILKEIDIPYIPAEWRSLLANKSAKAGSIIGKYCQKMRLNQFKRYRWADTEYLVKQDKESLLAALRQESESETEAESKLEDALALKGIGPVVKPLESSMAQNFYGLTPNTSKYNLTQEEINRLKIDWGEDYTEDQYLQLEQLYSDMKKSYVIIDPIAISNAKMICKMTTKMNKFLDIDDVESASKLSRQLDLFIKSANLAPVQQKERQQSTFSISQLAFLVEKEGGFIPEFYIEQPNDKIDLLLKDIQDYTTQLVMGEPQLGDMIQNAKQILEEYKLPDEVESYDDFTALEAEVLGNQEIEGEDDE